MSVQEVMTAEDLNIRIASHKKWLTDPMSESGKQLVLTGVTLIGINLSGATMEHCKLRGCKLVDCSLVGARLRECELTHCEFVRCQLEDATLTECSISSCRVADSDLSHTVWQGCLLEDVCFYRIQLAVAQVNDCELIAVRFIECGLDGSKFDNQCRLCDVTGDGHVIRNLQLPRWSVVIYHDRMQIGCRNHTIQAWRHFTDDQITSMDSGLRAITWWREHHQLIFDYIGLVCENKPVPPKPDSAVES